MSDFIEVYPSVIPKEHCEYLKKLFDITKAQSLGQDNKQGVSQTILNELVDQNYYNQFIKFIIPHLVTYLTKYYQVLLAGTSLTLTHPKTGKLTKLTSDNFEEIGSLQVEIMIKKMFRLSPFVMQKSKVDSDSTTIFHSDSYPQNDNQESLHRILKISLFLNDIEEGGDIEFIDYPRKIKAQQGSIAIYPAYFTHTYRQLKPISADAYQVDFWLMYQQSQNIY